jgi:hypothetical protein
MKDLPIIARRPLSSLLVARAIFAVAGQLTIPHELLSHLPLKHVDVLDKFVTNENVQTLRLLVVDFHNEILPCRSMGKGDAHFLGVRRRKMHRILVAYGNGCTKGHEPFQTRVAETPAVVHLAVEKIRVPF